MALPGLDGTVAAMAAASHGSRVVAFFDLDHTLLARNSGVLYARAMHKRGTLSTFDTLRSMMWGALHFIGKLDVQQTYQRAGELFRGMSGAHVQREVDDWFEREASLLLRPGGRTALAHHRARGERTVLITNSSSYIANAAARVWGLDAWLANDILVDERGLITGEVSSPLCYGAGKVHKAKHWAMQHGVSLRDACFYSDSISDLPLLEAVGTPEVVHPDPRLSRVAKQRGWRVHNWS